MPAPLRVVLCLLVLCQAMSSAKAADDAAVAALVAEADRAAAELPTGKAALEHRPIWLSLANARVGIGDIAGGIEALDRVNKDHDYSLCSAWIMQLEAEGKLTPEPTVKEAKVMSLHRLGAMNVLSGLGDFDGGIAQLNLMPDGEPKQIALARCYLQAGHSYYKGKNEFVIDGKGDLKCLENFKNAMETAFKIRNPTAALPLMLEVCDRYHEVALDLAAQPLVEKVEEALETLPPNAPILMLWQYAGKVRLLLNDDAGATKDFEKAKSLYGKFGEPTTGIAWDALAYPVFEHQLRWEVLRKQKKDKDAAALIPTWAKALTSLDVKFQTPKLVGTLVDACLISGDSATAKQLLDGLEPPLRAGTLQELRRSDESKESPPYNIALGKYCETIAADPGLRPLHPAALVIACECFRKLGDRAKFQACYAQGLKVSAEDDYGHHVQFGRFLVDAGRIEQAQALAKDLPAVPRAQVLSGLAAHATAKMNKAKRTAAAAKP